MNEWHTNSPVWHPKYDTLCEIRLYTGETFLATLWKANPAFHKKHLVPDRWRRPEKELTKKERWIDDDKVAEWRYV